MKSLIRIVFPIGNAQIKKLRALWFAVIVSFFLLLSNSSSSAAAFAQWTVMVYMSGDNNIEDYIVKDIELELAAVGSTAEVQVVALADRGPGYDRSYGDWQTTKLFHVTRGMTAAPENAVADWGGAQHGQSPNARRFRNLDPEQFTRTALCPVFLGAWVELASGVRHAG